MSPEPDGSYSHEWNSVKPNVLSPSPPLSSILFSSLSPSLWETARYRLKYCLKGPLNPKQPTNQPSPPALLTILKGIKIMFLFVLYLTIGYKKLVCFVSFSYSFHVSQK